MRFYKTIQLYYSGCLWSGLTIILFRPIKAWGQCFEGLLWWDWDCPVLAKQQLTLLSLSTLRVLRSGAPIDLTFAHLAASFDVASDQANSLLWSRSPISKYFLTAYFVAYCFTKSFLIYFLFDQVLSSQSTKIDKPRYWRGQFQGSRVIFTSALKLRIFFEYWFLIKRWELRELSPSNLSVKIQWPLKLQA